MPIWLSWTLKGLAVGLVGAAVNFLIMVKALQRMQNIPEKANKTLGICYLLRFVVSLGTLLLAFFLVKSIPFLLGVAVGLTIPGYFYFLYFKGKQNLERKE